MNKIQKGLGSPWNGDKGTTGKFQVTRARQEPKNISFTQTYVLVHKHYAEDWVSEAPGIFSSCPSYSLSQNKVQRQNRPLSSPSFLSLAMPHGSSSQERHGDRSWNMSECKCWGQWGQARETWGDDGNLQARDTRPGAEARQRDGQVSRSRDTSLVQASRWWCCFWPDPGRKASKQILGGERRLLATQHLWEGLRANLMGDVCISEGRTSSVLGSRCIPVKPGLPPLTQQQVRRAKIQFPWDISEAHNLFAHVPCCQPAVGLKSQKPGCHSGLCSYSAHSLEILAFQITCNFIKR